MILPHVRASFGPSEADLVVDLLAGGDDGARERQERRMREQGFDSLLDDPRTLNAVLASDRIGGASDRLVFYLLVRHVLLESGVDDRTLADYIAALLLDFGTGRRAYTPDEADGRRFEYLVDIVQAIDTADHRRAFLLQVHLGNFALWLSGLFPDHITARVERRGAPGIEYYEELGATGYRLAADSSNAASSGLHRIFRTCAESFPTLRVALNRISDRYLFPTAGDPVDRMLRQIADRFRTHDAPDG